MTTIEQTGAEEVAWDLSDLYASGDDPRIESDFAEAEAATAAFRDRYYGKVASLSAAELADAIDERERIEAIATRALYYAHMSFSTNMADPARGALVAKLGEKAAEPRDAAPLLRPRVGRDRGRAGRGSCSTDPALDHWRHWLSAQRVFRPYLLTEPEEKILTEKAVSGVSAWSRLYEEVLGAHARRPRRRGRAGLARDGDGEALLVRPRRAAGGSRGRHRGAGARPPHPHVHLQHDPRRQVDRRSAPRLPDVDHVAQPRERDDRRRGAGADRRRDVALRRAAALLPAQGEAARARPARALRPLRARRRRRLEDVVGRGAPGRRRGVQRASRARQGPRSSGSSTTAGSTLRCGPTSATAPTAPPTCRASTRTSS